MRGWRVHPTLRKGQPVAGSFDYCQTQTCPQDHFIYQPFHGARPAIDSWEGMLDSRGKTPK